MLYFAHTRKACGPLALALALTACGEETNVANSGPAQAAEDTLAVLAEQGYDRLARRPSNLSQSTLNQQFSPPQPGPSDQGISDEQNPRFLVAEQSYQLTPAAPLPANINKIELSNGGSVIPAPAQNTRPAPGAPIAGRPSLPGGDTLPVEPPGQQPAPPATLPTAPPVTTGDPLVSLVAKTDSNVNGGGTQLEWNTENVDTCETSGAWEGAVGTSGVVSLNHEASGEHTYMISCSGALGTAMAMVTVTVESTSLAWEAPARNTDGSALTDLAGYNMYYGTESGRYTQVKPVRDASTTELELPVEPGTYYLAMTAYDMTGNESELSNEIIRIVN